MNRTFAHVLPNFTIDSIIVVSEQDVNYLTFPESEPVGQEFLRNLFNNNDTWLETSENGEFRGRYAQIDGFYDPVLDKFFPPPL